MKELKKSFSYGQLKEELEQLFEDPDWQQKKNHIFWPWICCVEQGCSGDVNYFFFLDYWKTEAYPIQVLKRAKEEDR